MLAIVAILILLAFLVFPLLLWRPRWRWFMRPMRRPWVRPYRFPRFRGPRGRWRW